MDFKKQINWGEPLLSETGVTHEEDAEDSYPQEFDEEDEQQDQDDTQASLEDAKRHRRDSGPYRDYPTVQEVPLSALPDQFTIPGIERIALSKCPVDMVPLTNAPTSEELKASQVQMFNVLGISLLKGVLKVDNFGDLRCITSTVLGYIKTKQEVLGDKEEGDKSTGWGTIIETK